MLPNKRSLRLCVYNYKGGAAKTTIVVNTAAALAHPDQTSGRPTRKTEYHAV